MTWLKGRRSYIFKGEGEYSARIHVGFTQSSVLWGGLCVCRERGHGDGGGPREAGGVYRTAVSVSAGRSLSARRHAALAGEHGPETHISYSVHSSQHTQHCIREVQEEALPQI